MKKSQILIMCGLLVMALGSCNKKPSRKTANNQPTTNEQTVTQAPIPQDLIPVNGPTVVDFYATWCGPCKQLAPILEKLEQKYQGRVSFIRIDVDEEPGLAQAFQVESIPTLFFITPAGVVDASIGLQSEGDLEAQIQAMLAR
jgi:thioredoxin 1